MNYKVAQGGCDFTKLFQTWTRVKFCNSHLEINLED